MSKFKLNEFLKTSISYALVILQFCIIFFHFLKIRVPADREIFNNISNLNFMGFLIIIIGLIIMFVSIKELGRNLSPFPKPKYNSTLVTSGIYSYIRHPMYFSLILISLGFFLTKLTFYYLFLTVSLILIIKLKVYLEEEYLSKRFKNYSFYKNEVKY